jgi:putative DNA primase/helicase
MPDDNVASRLAAAALMNQLRDRARDAAAGDNEHGAPPGSEQWLALRFAAEHSGDLRYTAIWNQWHIWQDVRWVRDEKLRTFSLAAELCRAEALKANKPSVQAELAKAKTRANVVSLARENPKLAMTVDEWDADPWIL